MSQLSKAIVCLAGLILVFSSIVFLINHFIYQFQGNNYFPDHVLILVFILILFNLGLMLCFKKNTKSRKMGLELLYFFFVMALIALATNAVQLTPFPTIDQGIVSFEASLHIDLKDFLIWSHQHSQLQSILAVIYNSLPYQMAALPLILIVTCRFHLLREYYFLLLCTTLLGFTFYYFFPTTAPASVIHSSLFSKEQIATGLKFNQIHHHLIPTTNAGGLIAFPSFHAIWAILCVYLLKEWFIPGILLLMINLLLIASCVLLGWHYSTDIAGSFLVLLISYYFLDYL